MQRLLVLPASALMLTTTHVNAASISNVDTGALALDSGSYVNVTIIDDNDAAGSTNGVADADERRSLISEGSLESTTISTTDSSTSYRTDISSGEIGVGASVSDPARSSSAVTAMVFDTLTFDFAGDATSGLASFSLNVDGQMSNTGDAQPNFFARVQIADITGLEDGFFVNGTTNPDIDSAALQRLTFNSGTIVEEPEGPNSLDRVAAISTPVLSVDGQVSVVEADTGFCGFVSFDFCSEIEDVTGNPVDIAFDLTGEFLAEQGRTYGIIILNETSIFGTGDGVSDFLGTSSFSFDLDDNVSIFSASGALPGTEAFPDMPDEVNPIPLPASLPLLLASFGGLVALRRRKSSAVA